MASSQLTGTNWPAPLGANALEGVHQAIGAVSALGVSGNLGAQHALSVLMAWVAKHLNGTPVLYGGQ
jgi:glucose-6-phosphate dehydrogenase assembly protein OpcA